jgi:hypothetical protein
MRALMVLVGNLPWAFFSTGCGTLIATAKLNDIDPQAWLADVLTCWPAYRIIPPSASTKSCLGTGALKASLTPHERNRLSAKAT